MAEAADRYELEESCVLYFRGRRSHLTGGGASDPAAAVRAILGAQSQQEAPGLFAASLRCDPRPTAAEVRAQLFGEGSRRLVRTWGQRDTVHIFDPEDWPLVVAARAEWPQSGRRGALPSEPDLEVARRLFEAADGPLLRTDLFDIIPERFVKEVADHPGVPSAGDSALRFAASRLIWRLALAGEVCFGEKQGAQQTYVHRKLWFPHLAWNELSAAEAATGLARRYLAVHGPAAPQDLAHFFGATVASARGWLERLAPELVEVRCGSRESLVALRRDLKALQQPAPEGLRAWPVRFLPKWDTHLMRHADKGWLMPDESERPLVWRKAADISATVVAHGRIVATWSHRATKTRVRVTVTPLSGWRRRYLPGAKREAAAFAAYLEIPKVTVTLP